MGAYVKLKKVRGCNGMVVGFLVSRGSCPVVTPELFQEALQIEGISDLPGTLVTADQGAEVGEQVRQLLFCLVCEKRYRYSLSQK